MRLTFRTRHAHTVIAPEPPVSIGADEPAQFPMLARSEAFAEDLADLTGTATLGEPFIQRPICLFMSAQ
jgi:hypothetical protein